MVGAAIALKGFPTADLYPAFCLTVLLVGATLGRGPGYFSLGLSALLLPYFVLKGPGFAVADPADALGLVLFILCGLCAAFLGGAARARRRVVARLNDVSDQLLHAQEQERQRIAVELHDATSQHLAGLVLGLASLRRRTRDNHGAQALIEEMETLVQHAVRETRVLSYLMNASRQDPEDLASAGRRFVEGFGRRTGLETSFDAAGPLDAISPAAQHALFRVIQESLTNVHRHARATRAVVSLVSRADKLTLSIADDGQGMPSAPGEDAPLGVGIPGMRSRIEQLGGRLHITSDPSGAVVTATLPLHRPS
jgi:signal transduction histidine kinase